MDHLTGYRNFLVEEKGASENTVSSYLRDVTQYFRWLSSEDLSPESATQADVEYKQYLLATGQLDDAHSLPIAETKAALSLDILITMRNKAIESYNELLKMNV